MKQTQDERLAYLTAYLWNEAHGDNPIVDEGRSKWELYRGLQNVRPPKPIDDAFIQVQDAYLSELNQKHVTYIEDLEPELNQNIYLWQGDITTLAVDGIVNAANSKFLGCMQANHNCIDNIIHTKAGVQLRLACDEIIKKQGKKEGVGKAKITSSYNLPSQYVIHTVGPQVQRKPVSQMNKDLLAKSYRSCLKLADENGLKHLAFCCISTGVFGFPQEEATKIAIETTLNYLNETNSPIKVIFNVFKDKDFQLYKEALSQHE